MFWKKFLNAKDNEKYQEKLKAFDSSDSFIKNFKDLVSFDYKVICEKNMEWIEDDVFLFN